MTDSTVEVLRKTIEWFYERSASQEIAREDARAILEEFYEWIDCDEDDELDILVSMSHS